MKRTLEQSPCEGCTVYRGKRPCFARTHKQENDCPCKMCLVKVTCITECNTYSEFAEHIIVKDKI